MHGRMEDFGMKNYYQLSQNEVGEESMEKKGIDFK